MCLDFTLPHCHHHGPQRSPRCSNRCDANATGEHKVFAHDKYKFDGKTLSADGEAHIMRMIMHGGPVECAFDVYSDFENYVSGIYHHVTGHFAGGHAVKMVGWGVENGVKYWKI